MAMGTRKKWGRRRKRVPLDASRGVVGSGGWEIVVRLMVAPLLGVGVAATAAGVGEKEIEMVAVVCLLQLQLWRKKEK